MIVLKNILVATDFGEPAAAALDYGRDFARQYGANLHVFFVEDDIVARYASDMSPVFMPDAQRNLEKAAQGRLDALITDEDRQQLHARASVRAALSPALEIVQYAKDHAIDLIIVGTHGRRAIAHFLLGSVAERVARTAPCPVLTVRRPERDFIAPDALSTITRA